VSTGNKPTEETGESTKLKLEIVKRTHPIVLEMMPRHYSKPLGFVGRNIVYLIYFGSTCYGVTVAGSATRFLPNRNEFLGIDLTSLNYVANNIFFHVEKNGGYPCRNFVPLVISKWRERVQQDWFEKYGDPIWGFETLVELPRSGDCYKRDGWMLIGKTHGFTCKRTAGKGTDSWSGKRIWDTTNLRPKLVFARRLSPA